MHTSTTERLTTQGILPCPTSRPRPLAPCSPPISDLPSPISPPHDPFEQLTGNGLVYLLWDELLRQCQIGSMQNVPFADHTDRSRHMAELLRLFDTKCKISTILLRLRAIQS